MAPPTPPHTPDAPATLASLPESAKRRMRHLADDPRENGRTPTIMARSRGPWVGLDIACRFREALPRHVYPGGWKISRPLQVRQRRCTTRARTRSARRMAGSEGRGGPAGAGLIFPPPADLPEPQLLVRLLAAPPRLDGGGERSARGAHRVVGQVVLRLARIPPLADEPRGFTGEVLPAGLLSPVRGVDPHGGEARREWSLRAGAPRQSAPPREPRRLRAPSPLSAPPGRLTTARRGARWLRAGVVPARRADRALIGRVSTGRPGTRSRRRSGR